MWQDNEVMQISGGLPGLPGAALQESAGETQALSGGQTSRQNGCAAALENMEGASFAFGDDAGILNVYDLDLFAEVGVHSFALPWHCKQLHHILLI